MGMSVAYFERRDGADRAALGQAAFDLCRSQRIMDGVEESRFYWAGPDQVVIQTRTSKHVDWTRPDPKVATSQFALADLARQVRMEEWMDPRLGEENYRRAGRQV